MTDGLKWAVFALCLALAASRFQAVRRGGSRALFTGFLLVAATVALNIGSAYVAVDAVLGGRNYANLLLHLMLYGVFVILGFKVAAAYRSRLGSKLIRGPAGMVVLAVLAAVMTAFFFASDVPTSSVGLGRFAGQRMVQLYSQAALLYPAYVAAVLLGPVAAAPFRPGRPLSRAAGALLGIGFVLVLVSTGMAFTTCFGPMFARLNYGALLSVAVGLTLVWFDQRLNRRRRSNPLRSEQ